MKGNSKEFSMVKKDVSGPCEVVIAHFYFGSQTCGVSGTCVLEMSDGGKILCDEHAAEWKQLSKKVRGQ